MFLALVMLACTGLLYPDPPERTETPRKPNPLAPSLPELTEEEEDKLDKTIDRFIQYDTGKLKGAEGKKALEDFNKLGPEAIPALIRGLNRAAKIDHSCPAVTIAKKLTRMLSATKDTELLEFARENVGAGITQSRHMGVLRDLRVLCMVRKRQVINSGTTVARNAPTLKGPSAPSGAPKDKGLGGMSITELVEAAGKERGSRLKMVLTELGKRRGDEVIGALGSAAASYEGDIQQLARELLTKQLSNLSNTALKEKLKDDRAEVRATAARVVSSKGLHFERELIDFLTDEEAGVRQAGHDALVQLNKGTDFGPKANATEAERKEAVEKWRTWLAKPGGR
jgi:hypothetical protein